MLSHVKHKAHKLSALAPLTAALLLATNCGYSGPPENATLQEVCSVPNSELAQFRAGPFDQMAAAGKAVVYLTKENRYALLELPGCRVTPLADVPSRAGLASVMHITPSGARFFSTYAPGRPSLPYWYSPNPATAPIEVPLDAELTRNANPVLSEDGRWIALLSTIRTPNESRNEIILVAPNGQRARSFWPAGVEFSWHELVAIDVPKQELVLSRGLREYLWVKFDGAAVREPASTGALQAQPPTFRWVSDGWFAWDAYRDTAPYGWELSLRGRRISKAVEKLRRINHGAVSRDGRFVALSLETEHGRLLSLRDAVVIYDTASEGAEKSRKYLPRFTRTPVAFLGNAHLAYGDSGRVHLLDLRESKRE